MKTYSIENDKRIYIVGFVIAFSVILYYCIDHYLFAPYRPDDNDLVNVLFFFLPVTSLGIAWIILLTIRPLIFMYCNICNNSGVYKGYLKTSWDNFITEIPAEIKIEQSLFEMKIKLKTSSSYGENKTAHVDCGKESKIIYTYVNDGNPINPEMKTHRGTGELIIAEGKLTGRYYNDYRERETYGIFNMEKVQ